MANDWMVIATYSSLPEAEFLKSLLAAEGIDAQVPDEYTVGVDPGLINALGGVRLIVRAKDLSRAEEILAAART